MADAPRSAPSVSVIMAVHDGAGTIAAAVESVLGQTLHDLELIVVDDRSTDGTLQVLAAYADDDRLIVHASPDRLGTARARNLAMRLARGPLVAVADADDLSLPDRLALQAARFAADPGLVAVGAQMSEFGDWGERLDAYRWPERPEDVRRAFERGRMGIAHAAAMFRRDAALEVGGYDAVCTRSEDLALFRKLAGAPMAALPDRLVRYRTSPSVGLRYVWREMYFSVLAEQRNPLGARDSSGPSRLGAAGVVKALRWTARSWSVRTARELVARTRAARPGR